MTAASPQPSDRRDAPGWQDALLRPQSVALVGVSADPARNSGRPLRFLRRAGYPGRCHVVHAKRREVQGVPAVPRLADLPERPDHVFILTGADAALEALQDCARLGVPVATLLASGFAEAGAEGAARLQRLREILRGSGLRVLGPSSIGVADLHSRLLLTANAAFAEPDLPVGDIFVASHSGSLIGALLSRGKARGLGFAGLVSVGQEVDLSLGEICEAMLERDDIGGYLLFLESMRHADALYRFALEAARRGRPVAAFKLGRTAVGADLAQTHTGALAGEDAVADRFLQDCGIARVDTLDGLLEILPALRRIPPRPAAGAARRPAAVGVVTTTGGGAAMAVDQLALRGVEVAAPSATTRTQLRERGIDAEEGRIVDLTLAGTRPEVMGAALEVMTAAPEFDVVLATVGSSARFNPDLAVLPVIAASAGSGHPVTGFLVPDAPEATALLAAAGVPVARTPESCADVLAAALSRRLPRTDLLPPPSGTAAPRVRGLDEAAAYALLGRLGLSAAPHVVVRDVPAPLPFPYPVAAKLLDADVAHKSDLGGVILGIGDAGALTAALARIRAGVEAARPDLQADRFLVQAMVHGCGELLLGYRVDPDMGPVVILAAGGLRAELDRDRALRMAPVDAATAREMIGEVRACTLLSGWRGAERGDLEAVVQALVALSTLATVAPEVVEAEVNPLVVLPEGDGVVAVDAVVRVRQPADEG